MGPSAGRAGGKLVETGRAQCHTTKGSEGFKKTGMKGAVSGTRKMRMRSSHLRLRPAVAGGSSAVPGQLWEWQQVEVKTV